MRPRDLVNHVGRVTVVPERVLAAVADVGRGHHGAVDRARHIERDIRVGVQALRVHRLELREEAGKESAAALLRGRREIDQPVLVRATGLLHRNGHG